MKALNDLKQHCWKLMDKMKKIFILILFFPFFYAQELQNYLLPEYKELFATKFQKELASKYYNQLSWISPITISYSKTWSNQITARHRLQKSFSISINQPIFRFGGIYYGIKFAKTQYNLNMTALKEEEKKLIVQAISLVFQLKKSDLAIHKAKLQIANAQLRVKKIKELYNSGMADSLTFEDELIKLNEAKIALLHLLEQKNQLVANFKKLSNKDYKKIPLPKLKLLSKEQYLQNNFEIRKAQNAYLHAINAKKVTMAKYLPTISVSASYNYITPSDFAKRDFTKYGLSISLPISVNAFNDLQKAKLAEIESALNIKTTQRAQEQEYKALIKNIALLHQKELLAKEELRLYKKLYYHTKVLYKAGQKSKEDVKLFYNMFKIKQDDCKIYYLEKELQLLKLYEKTML